MKLTSPLISKKKIFQNDTFNYLYIEVFSGITLERQAMFSLSGYIEKQ